MRFLVAHHYWNRPGGGELYNAALVYALHGLGEIAIVSTTRPLLDRYRDWFGIPVDQYVSKIYSLPITRVRAFGLYLRLLLPYIVKSAVKKFRPDVLFIDFAVYKPALREIRKLGTKLVEYIHFPFEVAFDPRFRDKPWWWERDPYIAERYGKFPLNIYLKLFVKLCRRVLRENPFTDADMVLCNSKWTADVVEEAYGGRPVILNPPLPVEEIRHVPRPYEEREDLVVMVGRFSEEKRYHWVLQHIAPQLLKHNIKLVIIGSTGTRTSRMYYEKLIDYIRKHDLKNVVLIPDASRSTINEYLSRAKVFLHACVNEHWGVAVAEAMSHGTPAVVHKSGGTWTDLVEEGVRGLGYETAEECIEAILKLVTDEKTWRHYSTRAFEKAKTLTLPRFREQLRELLKKLL